MSTTVRKRPVLLTIVCVLGFIWIVFSFPGVFSPSVKKMGDWFPALYGLFVAANFMSFIGIWHMKRWGAALFIINFFVKEMVFILAEDISYIGIFFSLFFIVSILFHYKKMDVNL